MKHGLRFLGFCLILALTCQHLLPPAANAQVGDLKKTDVLEVPFILWGGDVATFHANGGLDTKPGTIFQKHGLRLKLFREDDFDKQVKRYLKGDSPFLRGTMSMLGQAADLLGSDERTRPVVFLQLTWSAGDHLVARGGIKLLNDLKGKKIALQKGGPHVGMLDDVLRTARLKWSDITPVWTDDVTGDKGPAARLRKDVSVDACFAITPDMTDLTGGLDKKGDGIKDSVKGAHVLVSTAHMSRSIADVYACRKDFFDKNRDVIEKFAAGYLKASEELVALRKQYKDKKEIPAEYKSILTMTKDIYGKDDIKSEQDAADLVDDAAFVGLHGNVSFFKDKGNLAGFDVKMRGALDLAVELGDIKKRVDFLSANLDYDKIRQLGQLVNKPLPANRQRDDVKFLPENTIYFFTIGFEPNVDKFPAEKYGDDYQRALEMASLFGKAGIAVRGHGDPTNLLKNFVKNGKARKILKDETGTGCVLIKDNSRLEFVKDMRKVVDIINTEMPDGKTIPQQLQDLSERRAGEVRRSLVSFAQAKGYQLDESQIRAQGVGPLEPIVADVTATPDKFGVNRRVEFRIIRISVEMAEFDYY